MAEENSRSLPTAGSETAFVLVTFMLTELGEGQTHIDDYTSEYYIGWMMQKNLDFAKIKLRNYFQS